MKYDVYELWHINEKCKLEPIFELWGKPKEFIIKTTKEKYKTSDFAITDHYILNEEAKRIFEDEKVDMILIIVSEYDPVPIPRRVLKEVI